MRLLWGRGAYRQSSREQRRPREQTLNITQIVVSWAQLEVPNENTHEFSLLNHSASDLRES
jgi:hypothetical protein